MENIFFDVAFGLHWAGIDLLVRALARDQCPLEPASISSFEVSLIDSALDGPYLLDQPRPVQRW